MKSIRGPACRCDDARINPRVTWDERHAAFHDGWPWSWVESWCRLGVPRLTHCLEQSAVRIASSASPAGLRFGLRCDLQPTEDRPLFCLYLGRAHEHCSNDQHGGDPHRRLLALAEARARTRSRFPPPPPLAFSDAPWQEMGLRGRRPNRCPCATSLPRTSLSINRQIGPMLRMYATPWFRRQRTGPRTQRQEKHSPKASQHGSCECSRDRREPTEGGSRTGRVLRRECCDTGARRAIE